MRIVLWIICALTIFSGCSSEKETPEQRFEIFRQAILTNDSHAVEQCLETNSIAYLKNEINTAAQATAWLEQLINDTKNSKPTYLKTSWIIRNKTARVHYLHSDGSEDYLILKKSNNRWYINLFFQEEQNVQTKELPKFTMK